VCEAQRKRVHLLLIHEHPSILEETEERRACEFNDFWNEGWTPRHLLTGKANVYQQIAIRRLDIKILPKFAGSAHRKSIEILAKFAAPAQNVWIEICGGKKRNPEKGQLVCGARQAWQELQSTSQVAAASVSSGNACEVDEPVARSDEARASLDAAAAMVAPPPTPAPPPRPANKVELASMSTAVPLP
jgi:hypothetical protein